MRAVDTTFPVDMLNAQRPAAQKARALDESGEQLAIPAPALAEFMVGAEFIGGTYLEGARRLAAQLIVLDSDEAVALEAGRLGAELMRRGLRMAAVDLLIAATCKLHQLTLITRDEAYARVPGLAVESY